MGIPGIGQDGHLRTRQGHGVGNLADMVGAQFDHRRDMLFGQLQQGQRYPEVIIEVATRGQHFAIQRRTQDGREHFLDRGLATGAGHCRQLATKRLTIQCAQLAQRQSCVSHLQLRQGQAGIRLLDQRRHGALGRHFRQVGMPVEIRPTQGNEQLPRLQAPAVRAQAAERHVPAQQTTIQGQGHFRQRQWLKHGPPPRHAEPRRPVAGR